MGKRGYHVTNVPEFYSISLCNNHSPCLQYYDLPFDLENLVLLNFVTNTSFTICCLWHAFCSSGDFISLKTAKGLIVNFLESTYSRGKVMNLSHWIFVC